MEVRVARSDEIPRGEMKAIQAEGIDIVLFRGHDDVLSALEDRCSHADVALSAGSFAEGEVTCLAHGARFDVRSGKQRCLPAVRPVRTFVVSERAGEVFVVIP